MSELQQLTEMFTRLGADRAQAETMAAQLLKRAGQLAAERQITREEALANLLRLVVQGRNGEAPGSSRPPVADGK
jgi:hypothetical protein